MEDESGGVVVPWIGAGSSGRTNGYEGEPNGLGVEGAEGTATEIHGGWEDGV